MRMSQPHPRIWGVSPGEDEEISNKSTFDDGLLIYVRSLCRRASRAATSFWRLETLYDVRFIGGQDVMTTATETPRAIVDCT